MNRRPPSAHDQVILKFMEKTIDNINTLLAGQHAIYSLLIEKGIVTESELLSKLRDSKKLPDRKRGMEALEEMLNPNWEDQINFQDSENALLDKALEKITQLSIPNRVGEDMIPPNSTAIRNATQTCQIIFKSWKMLPDLITASNDSGVFFKYLYNQRTLFMEFYNHGRVSTIVLDNLKCIAWQDENIQDYNFEKCMNVLTTKE